MGFCRRCGDIVSGERCKCGGLAVRASVNFSQKEPDSSQSDLWFRTYVRPTNESFPLRERSTTLPGSTPRPFADPPKRARAQSTHFSRSTFDEPVLSHIDSALTYESQDSKAVHTAKRNDIVDSPSSTSDDVLPDPNASTLAKAYGSVLQPKETLSIFTCIACSNPFLPDATLYPDPDEPTTTTRFLCKPCFTINGGTKGNCVSCGKSVLVLTSEGGFIENARRVWHKRCFRCDGCFKDISDKPMVDLLGRPSCEGCFDTCLKRPRTVSTASRRTSATPDSEERSNLGGMMRGDKREASPAIDELHQRLGVKSRVSSPLVERKGITPDHKSGSEDIDLAQPLPDLSVKSRESSPLIEGARTSFPGHRLSYEGIDMTQRLSDLSTKSESSSVTKDGSLEDATSPRRPDTSKNTKGRYAKFRFSSSSTSPKALALHSPSPRTESIAVEDMERRAQQHAFAKLTSNTSLSSTTSTRESLDDVSGTPALTDSSSCITMSPPPSTPPNSGGSPERREPSFDETPTKPEQADSYQTRIALSSPSTLCAKCLEPLFRTKNGGKFVTVPEESSKCLPPRSYHVECFRCAVCGEPFQETRNGQAVFVRASTGCCHVGCATPERIIIRPVKSKSSTAPLASSPTKQERPPTTAPPTMTSFRRFGSIVTCPGCHISVSPMEKGVVPGPQGSRWHASCLVCGGKPSRTGSRRDPNAPGCGKRLDSAAKTDGEGGVWCRVCLLLLGPSSKESSPIKPLERSFTGSTGTYRFPPEYGRKDEGIAQQFTGTTTIARQFTGLGSLTGHSTGGGLNPTRQLLRDLNRSPSPTKGFPLIRIGEGRRGVFPRPKSVIGIRGGKSADEGRGMYLVHQFTGNRGEAEP